MISSHSPSLPDAAHVMKRSHFSTNNQARVIPTTADVNIFSIREIRFHQYNVI